MAKKTAARNVSVATEKPKKEGNFVHKSHADIRDECRQIEANIGGILALCDEMKAMGVDSVDVLGYGNFVLAVTNTGLFKVHLDKAVLRQKQAMRQSKK